MNLQRDNYNLRNYKCLIRIISIVLIFTFLFQNFSWANPDFSSVKPHNLSVETNFTKAESSHRLTAKLIQRIIEDSVPRREELDLSIIKKTLQDYDAWKKKTKRKYSWKLKEDDAGLVTDIEITCKDNSNKIAAVIRYFERSDDPSAQEDLPKAWEDIEVVKVNDSVALQVKEVGKKQKARKEKAASSKRRTGKYGKILKAETAYKDYYRLILRNILMIFVHMAARRKKLLEENNELLAAGEMHGIERLLDTLARDASEFENRLKELGEEYSLTYKGKPLSAQFKKARNFLKKKENRSNEPALSAMLVPVLDVLGDAKEKVLEEKLAFWRELTLRSSSKGRVKVCRNEDGLIAIEIFRHVKADEHSKTRVKDRGISLHETRWAAGRYLDHQEEGCLDEIDEMKKAIYRLENIEENEELDKAASLPKAYEELLRIGKIMGDPVEEEKKIINDVISAVRVMVEEIGYTKYIPQLIPIASRHIGMRVQGLEDMVWHIDNGRVKDFRSMAEEENNSFLGYEGELIRLLKKGGYGEAYGRTKNGLIPKITPHFKEPELWEMKSILEALKYRFLNLYRLNKKEKDEKGRSDTKKRHIDKANLWMEVAGRKFTMTKLLGTFMERFRKEYVKRRMEVSHEETEEEEFKKKLEKLKKDTFKEIFINFIRLKKMDSDSPRTRAFQILCYLAVFVSPDKENPVKRSEKIPNPIFNYINTLRLFIEIDDIQAIQNAKWMPKLKETHYRFKRFKKSKRLQDLAIASKKRVKETLMKDFLLTEEEKEEVERILTENKRIMREYMKPTEEKGKPLGLIDAFVGFLIEKGIMSKEVAARFSFVWEEPLFLLVFFQTIPMICSFIGIFADIPVTPSLGSYVIANILFGLAHNVVYRWEAIKPIEFSILGGASYHTEQKEVDDTEQATIKQKMGISLLGIAMRAGYFIPFFSPLQKMFLSMITHALYNNCFGYKRKWPLAMAGFKQKEMDLFDVSERRKREKSFLKYEVYDLESLKKSRKLYGRLLYEEDLSVFTDYEKLLIWQYMILTNLSEKQPYFFKKIDDEVKRISDSHEIDGVYFGYDWSTRHGLTAEEKVETIHENKILSSKDNVLDVGCGDGKVIIDLATSYPASFFVGIDANPYNIAKAVDTLMIMGRRAPVNVRFHLRDCRGRGESEANELNKGIPYKAGSFDKVLLLDGVMDDESYKEKWESEVWAEVIKVTKKNGEEIVFYGEKGEESFYRSLPKGIEAEMRIGRFVLNGKVETKYYHWWGEPSEYRRNSLDLKIWKLGKEKPKPEPKPFRAVKETESVGPDQLDMFSDRKEGLAPGMIGWLVKPLIDKGFMSEEEAARLSFLWEEPLFALIFKCLLVWLVSVVGFPDANPLILYFAANLIYGFSHTVLYKWRYKEVVNVPLYGLKHFRSEETVTSENEFGEKEKARDVHKWGFFALGAIMRSVYFLPFINTFHAVALSMGIHAFYNNFISRRFDLPVGMAPIERKKQRFSWLTLKNVFFGTIIAATLSTVIVSAWSGMPAHLTVLPAAMVPVIFYIARIIEKRRLAYYTDVSNIIEVLNRPGGGPPNGDFKVRRKIRKLFHNVIKIYKSYFIRDLVRERKKLLVEIILINVKPAEEASTLGSDVRSDIAVELFLDEVLNSSDRSVYQPALEAIIELLAKEKRGHKTFFFNRFFPLLQKSGKLPRFSRALIDELIKAEHHKIRLFYIENENEFFDETREIIRMLAERSPDLKKDIMSYLFEIAETTNEEIPLVRALLDYMRFHVVISEDFGKFSAGKIAVEINRLQKELNRPVNIVLSGGRTMAEFFDSLAEMPGIDWAGVNIFQAAEIKDLSVEDEFSLAHFMYERFLRKTNIPASNIHFIGKNPDKKGYMEELRDAGGADIFVLGIGGNGHVAFNEPHSNPIEVDQLNEVTLSPETIEAKKAFHPDIEKAYTMSLADILASEAHVFLFAAGEAKADIVKRAFFGEVDFTNIPVSVFQQYPNVTVIFDKGAMQLVASNMIDKYLKAIQEQHRSEARYNELFDEAPTGLMRLDRDGIIVRANKKLAEMLGYTPEEMLWKPIFEFIPPDERGIAMEGYKRKMSRQMETKGFERKYLHKNGRVIWVYIEDKQILNTAGEVIGMRTSVQDITELKELQAKLEDQALRDPLTGALNQRYLEEIFPEIYEKYINSDIPLSLLVVDINDLKKINQAYGYSAGHKVMRQVARLLELSLEKRGDLLMREFGDEFLIILPNTKVAGANRVAQKIFERADILKYKIAEEDVPVGLTIGIAEAKDGESFDSLLARGDKALQVAKRKKEIKVFVDDSPPIDFKNGKSTWGKSLSLIIGLAGLGALSANMLIKHFSGEPLGMETALLMASMTFFAGVVKSNDDSFKEIEKKVNALHKKVGSVEKEVIRAGNSQKLVRKAFNKMKKLKPDADELLEKTNVISALDHALGTRLKIDSRKLERMMEDAGGWLEDQEKDKEEEEKEEKRADRFAKKGGIGEEDGEDEEDTSSSDSEMSEEILFDPREPDGFFEQAEADIDQIEDEMTGSSPGKLRYHLKKVKGMRSFIRGDVNQYKRWLMDNYREIYDRLVVLEEKLKELEEALEKKVKKTKTKVAPLKGIKVLERKIEELKKEAAKSKNEESILKKVRMQESALRNLTGVISAAYPKVFEEKKGKFEELERSLEEIKEEFERRRTRARTRRLKKALKKSGLSREKLAELQKIDPSDISKYLTGKETPPRSLIKLVADRAKEKAGWIWFGEELEDILKKTPKLNERLRITREYIGLSKSELCEVLKKKKYKFSHNTISQYESRDHENSTTGREMTPLYFRALASVAGVDPAILIFGKTLDKALESSVGISGRLEKARLYSGLSISKMAAKLGINIGRLKNYTTGKTKKIPPKIVDKIARITKINKDKLRKGEHLIEMMMIVGILGLVACFFIPMIKQYWHTFNFDSRDLFVAAGGYVLAVAVLGLLQIGDRMKNYYKRKAEFLDSVKRVDRVLIADDRKKHRQQVRAMFSHCSVIKEAESIDEAWEAVNENPQFDLVVSDLCFWANPIGSLGYFYFDKDLKAITKKEWKKTGRKKDLRVQKRKAGEFFVLALKNHEKAPKKIILQSTMFDFLSMDSFFNFMTGYNPSLAKRRVEKAGISVQPKSWVMKPHKHKSKTFLMWTVILGSIFALDLYVIAGNYSSDAVIRAFVAFSTLVLAIGVKAMKTKFNEIKAKIEVIESSEKIEKKADIKEETEKFKPKEWIKIKPSAEEEKPQEKKEPKPKEGKKLLEALEKLERLIEGNYGLVGELESSDFAYNISIFYAGKSGSTLLEKAESKISQINLEEDDEFSEKLQDLILNLSVIMEESKQLKAEVMMIRIVERRRKRGIEFIVRGFSEGVGDISRYSEAGFTDIVAGAGDTMVTIGDPSLADEVKESGEKMEEGTRVVARYFPEEVTRKEKKAEKKDEKKEEIPAQPRESGITHEEFNAELKKMLEEGGGKTVFTLNCEASPNNQDLSSDERYASLRETVQNELPILTPVPLVQIGREKTSDWAIIDLSNVIKGEPIRDLKVPERIEIVLVGRTGKKKEPLYWQREGGKRSVIQVAHAGRGINRDEDRMVIYLDENFVEDHLEDLQVLKDLVSEEMAEDLARRNGFYASKVHDQLFISNQLKALYDEYKVYYKDILGPNPNFIHGIFKYRKESEDQNVASGGSSSEGSVDKDLKKLLKDFIEKLEREGAKTVPIYYPHASKVKSFDMDVEIFKMFASSFVGIVPRIDENGEVKWYDTPVMGDESGAAIVHRMKIDEKYRIQLPGRVLEMYKGEPIFIRTYDDGRLGLWPETKVEQMFRGMDLRYSDDFGQNAKDFMAYSSTSVIPDSQGRIKFKSSFIDKNVRKFWKKRPTHFDVYISEKRVELHPVFEVKKKEENIISKEKVIANARKTARLLGRSLAALAERTKEREEEAVLVLDVPEEKLGSIQSLVKENVIEPLEKLGLKDPRIAARSKRLRIVGRNKIDMIRKKVKSGSLSRSNVIIMTTKEALPDLKDFEGSFITALDSSALKVLDKAELESYYYPYFEATFFSIIRAFGAYDYASYTEEEREKYRQRLWKWYREIPNMEKLTESDFLEKCFKEDHPNRLLILNLTLPRMEKIDPREVYIMIKDFILTQA